MYDCLAGWAYVPFIEKGAGFAGGAADLLCLFGGEGGGTVLYGYTIHDSYFGVFVWGMYMLC